MTPEERRLLARRIGYERRLGVPPNTDIHVVWDADGILRVMFMAKGNHRWYVRNQLGVLEASSTELVL